MDVRVAADAGAAAAEAAVLLEEHMRSALRRRGFVTVAVSGGATPGPMLARLARADLPWATVTVFQVDERVAPDGHPDRNILIVQPLIDVGAVVHAMPVTDPDLEGAAAAYASRLPDRFDVVHLGVGPDGHTASWPPGDPVIDAPGAVGISQPYQGRVRMTLTPRIVNGAVTRLVLVAGAAKAGALARWLQGDRSLPVSRVQQTDTILVVDREAAPAR